MIDIKHTRFAFVDTETTGLSPFNDRVIEIGIVVVENFRLVDSFSTLINPQRNLSLQISSITGIHSNETDNALPFSDHAIQIKDLLKGSIFVAHNAMFDYCFLREEFNRLDMDFPMLSLCTVKLSRLLYPNEKTHKLEDIIDRFNFTYNRRHRAYDDANILWQFMQRIQSEFSSEEITKAFKQLNIY